MILKSIFSLDWNFIISVIALVVSISTALSNWILNKQNLKIKIISDNHILDRTLVVHFEITNKSRQPVKLISIQLKVDNKLYKSAFIPLPIKGDGYDINGKIIKYEITSIELPYSFSAYDGLDTYAHFSILSKLNYEGKAKLIFNTTRGRIVKKINISKEN